MSFTKKEKKKIALACFLKNRDLLQIMSLDVLDKLCMSLPIFGNYNYKTKWVILEI